VDGIEGLLGFAGLIVAGFVLLKVRQSVNSAANRHVFARARYQEALQVREPFTVRVEAQPADVMRALDTRVQTTTSPIGMTGVTYKRSQTADRVVYAFGNKVQPESFRMSVTLEARGSVTEATCVLENWTEIDGLMAGVDVASVLRRQIQAALSALGTSAEIRSGLDGDEGGSSGGSGWEPLSAERVGDPGSPQWMTHSDWGPKKVAVLAVSAVLLLVSTWKLRQGVYPDEAPLYFVMLAAGTIGLYIAAKMKGAIRQSGGDQGEPGSSSAAVQGAEVSARTPAVRSAGQSLDPAIRSVGGPRPGTPRPSGLSALDGRAKALIAVGLTMVALAVGLSVMNAATQSSTTRMLEATDIGTDGAVEEDAPAEDTDSSEGSTYNAAVGADGVAGSDTPPAHMVPLKDMLAQAPSDGSEVTYNTAWDSESSMSGSRIAFTTDDPEHEGWTYVIDIGELTSCYVGDERAAPSHLIDQAFGMYHTGTITYSKDRLVEIRVTMDD
jgi:hypothetical protein